MNETSRLGKCIDVLLEFILKIFTYPCWLLLGVFVVCNKEFNSDYANYLSLIAALLYYLIERFNIAKRIVYSFKGKWKYSNGKQYHIQRWRFVLNNIIPIASLPFASLMIWLIPEECFNTNGLTFFALLLTILTVNIGEVKSEGEFVEK